MSSYTEVQGRNLRPVKDSLTQLRGAFASSALLRNLDALMGGFQRWRTYRGGSWFLIVEPMHPPIEYWSRRPPAEHDETWMTLLRSEDYGPRTRPIGS